MSRKNGKNSEAGTTTAGPAGRSPSGTLTATVSGVLATLLLAAGCGTESESAAVPESWGKLRTPAVTVAHPPAFEAQSAAERSKYNAAAATLSDESGAVGMITVQLDFTDADSVEEAAIGAEAGVALGSTLGKQEEITVSGPDGDLEARQVTFAFTQRDSAAGSGTGTPGGTLDPKAGTRVDGVIVAGLDTDDRTYAVRIDAVKGKLSKGDLNKIIDSITVE
ncbi:hypothetical protein OG875_09995 [Streptomyces sp. NBC_01498]|uniref:hypothetical protein n=1 Tax=Streptomyces sp. NBC_01498 TaxID=2975870 RepID=UPI002E7C50C2|nr:hypothetical protein [Streptomyces sp. NBC_01498]WTL24904.1 hypothetical protein OG875_09995 [Streptomyces sp. NBC_01498]